MLPDPSLPIPPVWSDYYEVVQMPYGMRAGQEKRSALYVEVFEGLRPSFGEWDIKYTFAKEAGAAANAERSGGSSGRPGGGGSGALPADRGSRGEALRRGAGFDEPGGVQPGGACGRTG